MTLHNWLTKREIGNVGGFSHRNEKNSLFRQIYSSFKCHRMWNPQSSACHRHHGGIFNFDFALDGSVLVAACERQSLLMFDPHNARLIGCQQEAHTDCVNYIRFLDSRLFASCSDDKTVCLWDLRYLKKSVTTLTGHSNWVKNIEYARGLGLLLTSGFDGSICTWDINKSSSSDSVGCNPIFHTSGLMRSRLTPDADKLVITTTEGYIIVIHDLDLTTLSQDLAGFEPNLYHMMQMGAFPVRRHMCRFNSLFTRKRNRVELISDFPSDNDAEMIASLDVHPQGWCIVSRNTSRDENSEWTCVHDIQGSIDEVELDEVVLEHQNHEGQKTPSSPEVTTDELNIAVSSSRSSAISLSEAFDFSASDGESTFSFQGSDISREEPGASSAPAVLRYNYENNEVLDAQPTVESENQFSFVIRSGNTEERIVLVMHQHGASDSARVLRLHKNRPRLLCYTDEPNVGRGFIKEICFSSDGRLVCSPFAYGVRLLAFDPDCKELCDSVPSAPVKLHEIVANTNRGGVVVSNKFSPTTALLVTGCLEGKIGFHQPVW